MDHEKHKMMDLGKAPARLESGPPKAPAKYYPSVHLDMAKDSPLRKYKPGDTFTAPCEFHITRMSEKDMDVEMRKMGY